MTANELQEFKKEIKEFIQNPSSSSSNVLDYVRNLVSQDAEPVKVKIDILVVLASLRLFSKSLFEVFEDKEMQSTLKLLY